MKYKHIFLVAIFIFVVKIASSQILIALLFGDKLNSENLQFGLSTGVNVSSLNYYEGHSRLSPNFGLYFNIRVHKKIWFSPSVMMLFPAGGNDLEPYPINDSILDPALQGTRVRRDLRYLTVPLMFRGYYHKGFYAELGPQLMLMTAATDRFQQSTDAGLLQFDRDILYAMNRFEAGLSFGLGYKVMRNDGMTFGARYYQGFTNIYQDASVADHVNSILTFQLCIPVGAKEKSPKQE